MSKQKRLPHKILVEEFYPWIRGQLMETDDPDRAYDFMNLCIMHNLITPGKADKMFKRRFPDETLAEYDRFLAKALMDKGDENAKLTNEAIKRREEAIRNLGYDPVEFERKMEEMVKERGLAPLDNSTNI